KTTSTTLSFVSAHSQKQATRQTNQSFASRLNTPTFSQHTPMMKWFTVIFFALTIMVVSSAIAQPPANMTAGTYNLSGSFTWYDQGGAGGTTCPGASGSNYS